MADQSMSDWALADLAAPTPGAETTGLEIQRQLSQRLGAMEGIAVCLEGFASLAVQPRLREPGSRDRGSERPVETVEG